MVTRRNRGVSSRRFDNRFSATESNVSRDELGVAPGPGAIGVWAASTAADGLLTVRLSGGIQLNRQTIPLEAALSINTENDAPLASAVVQGGARITVDYVEVASGTARIVVMWVGRDLGEA
jgi:hypothetical protein